MNVRCIYAGVMLQVTAFSVFSFASISYTPIINRTGQAGLFYVQSAKTLGMSRLVANAYANFTADKSFLVKLDSTDGLHALQIVNLMPSIGYGLTNFLDISAAMPVYWDNLSEIDEPFRGGFGDVEISGKFQYPPYPHNQSVEAAFFGAVVIPTGTENEGIFPRHTYYIENRDIGSITDTAEHRVDKITAYYTSKAVELDLKMLLTLDLEKLNKDSPVLVHVNFGAHFVTKAELDNLFLLNLAFEYHPAQWLGLFTEFSGETRIANVKNGFRLGDDPLRLSPGINFSAPGGFCLTLGGDISLNSDTTYLRYESDGTTYQTKIDPRWRVAASLGWNGYITPQDQDHDGIKDNVDRCPKDPEDLDNFQDQDGCPDPDNDNDGIPDLKDKCPNDPEDKDGFYDGDGCPDLDNDKDGSPDLKDQCPNVAEDLDGHQDDDGCPDFDNDNDGVPDSVDKCMTNPEDRDGFKDEDGCPDLDNDEDGVPDSVDKCRDTKGVPENQGCPMPVVEKPKPKEIQRGRVVLRGVNFEFSSAVLTGDSYAILEQVFESLKEWPEVKIEIRGHTDNVGSDDANRKLSQRRAESVRDYLISRGIDPWRLQAVGFGETDPIAENKTAEGRALNRRVELHRID
jgi:outer membrane protein OmpA-like peptidoglycan-associated protein